jgi:hypothetical protein
MEPASSPPWLGLIEFFVVLLFALGWGVLELVCRRMDRKRAAADAPSDRRDTAPGA